MSEPKERTRKINPMFGFLALIVAFGALVLVANQPAAADTFTSINTLVGAVTLAHFTSLNLTTSGNTLTLGINLGHANTWTATQTFSASCIIVGVDQTKLCDDGSIEYIKPATLSGLGDFNLYGAGGSIGFTIKPNTNLVAVGSWLSNLVPAVDNTYSLGSLSFRWQTLYLGTSLNFPSSGSPVINFETVGGVILNQIKLAVGGNNDVQILTMNAANNPTLRLDFGANAAQGSAGITSYEPWNFYAGSGQTLNFAISSTGLGNTQGFQSLIATTLSVGTSTTVNLPVAEPDTSYGVVCTLNNATPVALSISGQTMTQFVINYPSILAQEKAHCIIWHQ